MKSSLTLSLIVLAAACSKGGGGGGDGPVPTPPGVPAPEDGTDGGLTPEPETEEPQKLGPLSAASLDELVAKVAKDFKPEAATEDAISDQLELIDATFKRDGLTHLQEPRESAVSEEEDPDLEAGGTCKGLYSGFITFDIDWWVFDAQNVRDTIRYGVKPTDTEELKREIITEKPAYATISYKEHSKSTLFNSDYDRTWHVAKAGDQILLATEVLSSNPENKEGDTITRCARLLDFKGKVVSKACSSASYNYDQIARREDRTTSERLVAGKYLKDDREATTTGNESMSWHTRLEQTGENTEKFEHDFREHTTAADAGWFGALFSPYAYAKGELEFTRDAADATKVSDCKVKSVSFEP